MLDFMMVSTKSPKQGLIDIYPKFIINNPNDLMIRGGDFYAIWVEERGMWSTSEQDALKLIDKELDIYYEANKNRFDGSTVRVLHMWDSSSGMIDIWHKYCQKQMRDYYVTLDEKIIFANDAYDRKDYSSRRLPYPLVKSDIKAYDRLISVLYSPEERRKIEWAIGAIVTGEAKRIQKFAVLYGAAGTGKSTILNIIQKLFDGYYTVFDAKALGSSNNAFALEAFKTNPLVAIQHDGDLSHIEDNTRLNSLVSHELMTVNEKFKSTYANSFKCFLFMGTNKPVRITDAKSGLIRRLIDISPSGEKVSPSEYHSLMKSIDFELSGIAYHCKEVFLSDPGYFDDYIPTEMMGASNDFYNYIIDSYSLFLKEDSTTLRSAWERYKTWCEDTKVAYPFSQRVFKEELKNYFREYSERSIAEDGNRVRNLYTGFRTEKFEPMKKPEKTEQVDTKNWLVFDGSHSRFDELCLTCPAQYASNEGTPVKKWIDVTTTLANIDTSRLHYVRVPQNHIVIDLDICGPDGKKSKELNIKAAAMFPPTYAELSKSGNAVHLHYIYTGDITKLSRVYDDKIEIKIFTGNSSLRRKLSECNSMDISEISSGLPLKGEKPLISFDGLNNERALRTLIKKNLAKEYHPATKPSVDFIAKALDDMYESGKPYDVSDMKNEVLAFAAQSTNHADYCIKIVSRMKFKSQEQSENISDYKLDELIFFDIEVFPNLFIVNWKKAGENSSVVRMINPKPSEIESLVKYRLVGFNNRRYDNHILYARLIGYDIPQLYELSQKIITEGTGFFGEAYNLSYTDVYDFSAKKQSLKKFEIELGIHHQELGLPWDKPVPEELWCKVAEYCDNDVIATEAVFNARKADFTARQILADMAGMTVNDTTNSLTTRIIFGKNKKPQDRFNYRFMGVELTDSDDYIKHDDYTVFDDKGRPLFPGYSYEYDKQSKDYVSTYRGEEIGEGGYVYSNPGMYGNVALLDIASMHPSSIVAENLFGDEYTERFHDILNARIAIKHKDFDKARSMLGGVLGKYLDDKESAKNLAQALKIAINSVYGLTAAKFENPLRDSRNTDNIVAKRGALFMVNLKHEVQKRGYVVAHIKTDSIKIPNATPEIIAFVQEYGKKYGYSFEHEATYDRMTLVNDAVYIAKYATVEHCNELYGEAYVSSSDDICKDNKEHPGKWTATGTQFQVPYVFKKLFSKENIEFDDMCETKSVSGSIYLDMNESLPDVTTLEAEKAKLIKQGADTEKIDILTAEIEKGHSYHFVGKVGLFCPVVPGSGGGVLLRENNGKYAAIGGTKGYRWMESEMVKKLNKEEFVDRSYYDDLVNEAVESISSYGDFSLFVSDEPIPEAKPQWPPEEFNPYCMPCGRPKCTGCEHFVETQHDLYCKKGHDIYPF